MTDSEPTYPESEIDAAFDAAMTVEPHHEDDLIQEAYRAGFYAGIIAMDRRIRYPETRPPPEDG